MDKCEEIKSNWNYDNCMLTSPMVLCLLYRAGLEIVQPFKITTLNIFFN